MKAKITGRRAVRRITQLTSNTPPAIAIAAMIGQQGFCTSVHLFIQVFSSSLSSAMAMATASLPKPSTDT